MFDNIGEKIKGLAKGYFVVSSILGVLGGIIILACDIQTTVWNVIAGLMIPFAPLIAWVSSWILYGFGELIDKTCDIERHVREKSEYEDASSPNPLPPHMTAPHEPTSTSHHSTSSQKNSSAQIERHVNTVVDPQATSIKNFEFCGYNTMTEFIIPNGIISIGHNAFFDCSNLSSIDIPVSITEIGQFAFYYCEKLTTINYGGPKKQWNSIAKRLAWDSNTGDYTIHCTDGDIPKGES